MANKQLMPALNRILSHSEGEREIVPFLKKNPSLLFWTYCTTGGHSNYILHEFPFGSRYKADFVILFSFSGGWEVHLIELERVRDKVFTRNRTPARALNDALKQIKDWQEYIRRNDNNFRMDLADWAKRRDILKESERKYALSSESGLLLKDPETYVGYQYHIVIGRRVAIDHDIRNLMNRYRYDSIDIGTYDKFIDIAERMDRNSSLIFSRDDVW